MSGQSIHIGPIMVCDYAAKFSCQKFSLLCASGVVPINVSMVTGLPKAGGRLSPRVVIYLLSFTVTIISECVARFSLPATGTSRPIGEGRGTVTNLIPFKTLNLFFISHILLYIAFLVGTFLFISWLDVLDLLDYTSMGNGVGNFVANFVAANASWAPTLIFICLLSTMTKAKAHIWRKVTEWTEEHELAARCHRTRRFCTKSNSRPAMYRVEPEVQRLRAEEFGVMEMKVTQRRKQELEARHSRSFELESGPPQVLPLELELQEPHQRHCPIAKRQLTEHYLAKRQSNRQPLDEFIPAKRNTGLQETKKDDDKPPSVEESSANTVTLAKLIMVKPADIAVTLDSTT